MNKTFLTARILVTQALIVQYEAAIADLLTNNVQEYFLNTSQSDQRITRLNIGVLQKALDVAYNTLCTQEARLNGASIIVYPRF